MLLIFNFIRDFFTFVFSVFSCVIDWLGSITSLITTCITYAVKIFNVFPGTFYIALMAVVAVSVIYKVLGREGK